MSRKPKISETEARAAYLGMGPERSLRALLKAYEAQGIKPPSLRTLGTWSTEHDWQRLAAEHDERVAARVISKAETAQANEGFDAVKALTEAAEIALDALALKKAAAEAADKGDLRGMMSAAVDALKLREVLTGGVSDRTASENELTVRQEAARKKVDNAFAALAAKNAGAGETKLH